MNSTLKRRDLKPGCEDARPATTRQVLQGITRHDTSHQ